MRPLRLWSDSRWTYALGAIPAAMGGCALGISFELSTSGRELVGWALVAGIPAGLALSLCSLFGYHMVSANPHLHAVARWIALCVLTWLFLAVLVVILFVTHPRFGVQIVAPLAVAHAIWTAVFLLGRGLPER